MESLKTPKKTEKVKKKVNKSSILCTIAFMGTDVTFDKLLVEATDLLFQGDFLKAQAKLNKALLRKPGEPRALSMLANILSMKGDHAGATAMYNNLLSSFPDEPSLLFKLSIEYFSLGDIEQGYKKLIEARELDNENSTIDEFKKHIDKALGYNEEFNEDPSELSDELYKTVIKVYGMVESGDEGIKESISSMSPVPDSTDKPVSSQQIDEKINSEQKNNHEESLDKPPENKDLTAKKSSATNKSNSEKLKSAAPKESSEQSLNSKKIGKKSKAHKQKITSEVKKNRKKRSTPRDGVTTVDNFVIQSAEGIFSIDPSRIDTMAFSKDFLMIPLKKGWYLRDKLIFCSYKDFASEIVREKYRGSVEDRELADDIAGQLLDCTGSGSIVLKPLKDHTFIAFDIHNTPLYIREEMVIAFQHDLKWESGWLRSETKHLRMLSFRGKGRIFLQIKGSLFNIELPDEEFLLTPIDKLIGWEGFVVAQCHEGELVHAAGSGHLFLRS